jgi:hypothetical protein
LEIDVFGYRNRLADLEPFVKKKHPVVFRLQGAGWVYRVMPRAAAKLAMVIVFTFWVETSYT